MHEPIPIARTLAAYAASAVILYACAVMNSPS